MNPPFLYCTVHLQHKNQKTMGDVSHRVVSGTGLKLSFYFKNENVAWMKPHASHMEGMTGLFISNQLLFLSTDVVGCCRLAGCCLQCG